MDNQPSDWENIKQAFFKAPAIPPSETFVVRVMERIQARQSFDLGAFIRWAIPTLGLMFIALFFVSVVPMNAEEPLAFETKMIKGGSPFSMQDAATAQRDLDRDWMGLDAL